MRILRAVAVVVLGLSSSAALAATSTDGIPITTSSPEARQLFEQGREKAANMELADASKLADQAIAKDPDFALAYILRAQTDGSYPARRKAVAKAVSLADRVSPGERLWIQAFQAQVDGDVAATRQHVDQLLQQFPEDKYVQLFAARFERGAGHDDAKSAEHYQKAVSLDPSFAAAYNELGYVQAALGKDGAAEASFKKYIALRPDSPNPYDSYAEFLMKQGRYDDSIAQYQKALDKDPEFVNSIGGIGTNQVFKKEYQAARQTFERQRAKSTDLSGQLDAMQNIAMSYVYEGKPSDAVRVFDDIAGRASQGDQVARAADARLDAAVVLADSNKGTEAIQQAEQARNLVKDASSLPTAVQQRIEAGTQLARALGLAAQGKYDAATSTIADVRAGIERRHVPAEIDNLNQVLGTVALRQKHYQDAVNDLAKADQQDPRVLYQLAVAKDALGQKAAAATLFAKAANWNSSGLDYALVRSEAIQRSDANPVATSGKKQQDKR